MKRVNTRFSSTAETCGICLGYIEFQGLLDNCEHAFCYDCILRWASVNSKQTENTCPLCRTRFTLVERRRKRIEYFCEGEASKRWVPDKNQGLNPEEVYVLLQSARSLLSTSNGIQDGEELDIINRITQLLTLRLQGHNN